jgi:glucokinase
VTDGGGFVLGIDIGGSKVALATSGVGDPRRRLRERTIPTRADEGASRVLTRILATARAIADDTAAAYGGRLVAVGAVSPGIVGEDSILLAPNNPGWDRLALPSSLRDGLGVPTVVVGNDVKAAALAEARWGALAGAPTGIFLNLGTGVAVAVVVDGAVLSGAHGAAGEIAYNLHTPGDAGFASGRAPMEELASGSALAARGRAVAGRDVSAADVFAAASTDPQLRDLLGDALDVLAMHVANLTIAIDPAVIAVGGGLTGSFAQIRPTLEATLARTVPFPPRLLLGRFPHDAALVGALTHAHDAAERNPGAIADSNCSLDAIPDGLEGYG